MEVYTGTRPGKPALATILCAAAVVSALGLAFAQVHRARGLGDELRIPSTPLVVRVPRTWTDSPRSPGLFELRSRSSGATPAEQLVYRRILFRYQRLPGFQPVDRLLAEAYGIRVDGGVVRAASLAGLPSGEVRLLEQVGRARRLQRERIVRLACSPRGDLISVEYQPLTELTPADLELFEEICAAVRIDDTELTRAAEQVQSRAGIRFATPPDWRVCGADSEFVPGLFIEALDAGLPIWSLGVHRTWMSDGRGPKELLADFAAVYWNLSPPNVAPSVESLPDRVVATLRHPAPADAQPLIASARIVLVQSGGAVMLTVSTDARYLERAERAADQLARSIALGDGETVGDPVRAEASGRELAAQLTQRGAAPWWGKLDQQNEYAVTYAFTSAEGKTDRGAIDGDPQRGYRGAATFMIRDTNESRTSSWELDGDGIGYAYQLESKTVRRGRMRHVQIEERRTRGGNQVTRTVTETEGRRRTEVRFEVGPAFICPPAEPAAEFWVARQESGEWIVQVSTVEGGQTHRRRMRPIPPDDEGNYRLLIQDDFFPRGTVIAYDDDANLVRQVDGFATVERVQAAFD